MKDTAKETSDAEHYAAIGHNPTESGFKQALRASSVVLASFVVLGLGLGVIISAHHLPWWLAPAISLIVYAGSVEFLVVEMIATGASVGAIGFTTLLVNSRHLVYGISFPLQNVKGFWAKLYAIYTLCDESYALNTGPDRNTLSHARILWVSTFLHISWVVGTTAGFFIGASFLSHLEGMDFAMTALFTILAIDAYRAQRDNVTALLTLFSGAVGIILAPGSMLLVSMGTYTALLIVRFFIAKSRGTLPEHQIPAPENNTAVTAAEDSTTDQVKTSSPTFTHHDNSQENPHD